MAKKILIPLDMTQLEILNLRLQNLTSDPSSPTPVSGQIYFNSSTGLIRVYHSGSWISSGGNSFGVVTDGTNSATAAAASSTFKLRSASNLLTVLVTNDEAVHGDNALFTVNQGNIDHGSIAGLSDDDHSQYALLAGRSGGQTLKGSTASGQNLTLMSTDHATKGKILFGTSGYDEVNNRLGVGNASPTTPLDVTGVARATTFTATQTTGTAPFTVSSTTKVDNLNADLLDGYNTATTSGGGNAVVVADSGGKISSTFLAEVIALSDLSDVTAKTGTGSTVVMQSSPTISTPTIADFSNSTHTHQNSAGGGQLDHGAALTGLSDDDHTQYALLAGRSGGQTLRGDTASGGDLTISSTNHATKGKVYLNAAQTIFVDEANARFSVGQATPTTALHVNGTTTTTILVATQTTGTAPLTVSSTTVVTNLNADLVDGFHASSTPQPGLIPVADGSNKLAIGWISEVLASTDLSDVSAKTGTGTTVVFSSSPTIVTPTIASFANANHTHLNSAGGGTLTAAAITDFDTQVRTSRLDQMAAPTASVSFNSQKITNLLDPTNPQDGATKAYVDASVNTGTNKGTVRVATTATLSLTGSTSTTITNSGGLPSTLDGVTLATNDLILVKDEVGAGATGARTNGLYLYAAGNTWTRAGSADTSAEVTSGLFIFVSEGTTNGNNGYTLTTDAPITLGTTELTFTQTSGAGQITAGAGLTKTGNQLDVVGTTNRITANADSIDISASYVGQASITTLGTITTGVWTGTAIAVANGGTGATDASTARTNLGLGTIATQNANSVTITGGSITGITDLAVADGGTGASDASTARTNLGLGTIATQNASNVTISGGSITGITDLAVADGGTGASDASTARTNLGLGTIATQAANSVSITGGSITGLTTLQVGSDNAAVRAGSLTNGQMLSADSSGRVVSSGKVASTLTNKYTANIGDGSTTAIDVTHSLGTTDVVVMIREVSGLNYVEADITVVDSNTVTITFAVAPTTNFYRVIVVG